MASATGIPQEHPRTIEAEAEEPLLGGPGAATQKDEDAMPYNVFTGENLYTWLVSVWNEYSDMVH